MMILTPPEACFILVTMFRAVFPGSFDPPTFGHLNIIERASDIFEEVLVVVAENRQKKYLFSANERVSMIEEHIKHLKNVKCFVWAALIVEFLKKEDTRILIRGIRGMDDFSYEFELSMTYKALHPDIETFFMTTDPRYIVLR